MTRINVYAHEQDDYGQPTRRLAGWFNPDTSTSWREADDWNGQSHIGRESGIPREFGGHWLWRTRSGRWVLERDARHYHSGPHTYEFVEADAAREWLLRSDYDDAVEQHFGDIADEQGPDRGGRPEIGAVVNVRLGDLLARVDEFAAAHDVTRAAAIRQLVEAGLAHQMQHA